MGLWLAGGNAEVSVGEANRSAVLSPPPAPAGTHGSPFTAEAAGDGCKTLCASRMGTCNTTDGAEAHTAVCSCLKTTGKNCPSPVSVCPGDSLLHQLLQHQF